MAKVPHDNEQDTRERLLAAAAQVFAKKGFSGATVKAIADEAGCNVSLISYHFQGKEGLFRALLEGFGQERLKDAEKILLPPENLEDMRAKLRLWMQQFLMCHVQDDSLCSILHRENILEEEFLWDIFQNTFLKTFAAITRFLEAAKKSGILRKDIDPAAATVMLFGSLIHIGRNQKIQKKLFHVSIADEKYRAQITEQFLGILLYGISGSAP
ncbi:MAG: TetR/AcrR family transcriptional regulator [Bdellovibrionota bacterium]